VHIVIISYSESCIVIQK